MWEQKGHVVNLSVGVKVKIVSRVKPLQAFSAAGKRLARWCYGRLKWQQPSPWAFYHTIISQIRHPVATPVHTQTQIGLQSALLPAASLIMSPCHCQSTPCFIVARHLEKYLLPLFQITFPGYTDIFEPVTLGIELIVETKPYSCASMM